MSAPITGVAVFTNQAAAGVAAAGALSSPSDVSGTVIGIAQAGQSVISIATTGLDAALKPLAGTAGFLGVAGAINNGVNIINDINAGNPIQQSDVAGLLSNSAGAIASALVLFSVGEILIVPLTVVSIVGGGYQLVATANSWTVGANGTSTQAQLTSQQWATAAAQVQAINANPAILSSALQSAGVDPSAINTFLVPQTDPTGNITGYIQESPTQTLDLGQGQTLYSFSDGTTLTTQQNFTDANGVTHIVGSLSGYDTTWSIPQTNGQIATLQINSETGSNNFTVTDSSGNIITQLKDVNTQTQSNESNTLTQTFTSNLPGSQNEFQNQITTDGNTTSSQTTVFNSDGSVSYTENQSSTNGLVTSDQIEANLDASLALSGSNVVLNGLGGNDVSVSGQNDILNMNNGSVIFTSSVQGTVNGSNNQFTLGQDVTAAISGGGNVFSLNGNVAGSTFTLQSTDGDTDTLDLNDSSGATVLFGVGATAEISMGVDSSLNLVNSSGLSESISSNNSGDVSVSIGGISESTISASSIVSVSQNSDGTTSITYQANNSWMDVTQINSSGSLFNTNTLTEGGQTYAFSYDGTSSGFSGDSEPLTPTSSPSTLFFSPTLEISGFTIDGVNYAPGGTQTVSSAVDSASLIVDDPLENAFNAETSQNILSDESAIDSGFTGSLSADVAAAVQPFASELSTNDQFSTDVSTDVADGDGQAPDNVIDGSSVIQIADNPLAPDDDDPSDPDDADSGYGGFDESGGFFDHSPTFLDPLVLSTNGQGINLTPLAQSTATFNFSGSGAVPTGWVGSDTGILVYEPGDGDTVTSGSQLFSNTSSFAPGAQNGFQALAALDSNGDGVINASDPAFASIDVWVDANGNGVVDPGELESLSSLGIQSISIASTPTLVSVAGNIVNAVGTVTFTNGTTEAIDDVSFTAGSTIGSLTLNGESAAGLAFTTQVLAGLSAQAAGMASGVAQSINTSIADINAAGAQLTSDETLTKPGTLNHDLIYYDNTNNNPNIFGVAAPAAVQDAASYVTNMLTNVDNADNALLTAADDQSQSNADALTANIENANIGASDDLTATQTASTSEVAWQQVFLDLQGIGADIQSATAATTSAQTLVNEAILPQGDFYQSKPDADEAEDSINEQKQSLNGLALAELADQSMFSAIATAWGVNAVDLATNSTNLAVAGDDLVIASGSSTVADGSSASTYAILPSTTLDISDFIAGPGGSRLDFLSQGATATITQLSNGTQITVGSSTVLLLGVNASSLSLADNLAGIGTVQAVTVGLSSSFSDFDNGTSQVRLLTVNGVALYLPSAMASFTTPMTVIGSGGSDMLFFRNSLNQLVAWDVNSSGDLVSGPLALTSNGTPITVDSGETVLGTTTNENGMDVFVREDNGGVSVLQFSDNGALIGSQALENAGIAVTVDAQTTVIGSGTNLYGTGGNDVFLRNGSGQIIAWEIGASGNLSKQTVVSQGGSEQTVENFSGQNQSLSIGANDVVHVSDDTQGTITGVSGTVIVGTVDQIILNGSGLDILASGSDSSITATGTGNAFTVLGNENTLTGSGNGDTVILGGTDNTVTVSNSAVALFDNEQATIDGTGDRVSVGNADQAVLDGNDMTVTLSGVNSILTVNGAGGTLAVNGNSNVIAINGQDASISLEGLNNTVTATGSDISLADDSSETINGESDVVSLGNNIALKLDGSAMTVAVVGSGDTLDVSGSGDTVSVTGSNNTIDYNAGSGTLQIAASDSGTANNNVLQLDGGITEANLVVSSDSAGDIILTDGRSGDSIQIDGMQSAANSAVSEVKFSDGTVWSAQQLDTMAKTVMGTTGNDTLVGTLASGNVFDGKGGDDVEIGNGTNDTFVYDPGYGDLEINEDYNDPAVPVLQLGAGITEASLSVTTSADGSSLILTDDIAGDQITLDNMVSRFEWGVAEVQFADGSTLTAQELETMASEVNGTSGSDTLTGTSGSEVFNGDGGNDVEVGGGGSDVFIYNPGYGQLEINEDYFGGQTPILQLGAGITAASLSVTASADGTSLILSDGIAGDQITLDNMLSKDEWGVTEVRFADGTTLTAAQLIQQELTGTSGANVLVGTTDADVFDGKGGNDVEIGNDGSDTFIFNQGYGHLEIDEDYNAPATPVLQLGAGITEASLSVTTSADGSSLILTDGVAGDQITLDNMVSRFEWGVAEVQFADGSTLSAQQLLAMSRTITGTTSGQTLTGTGLADVFDSKGGNNDVEIGNDGSDTFIFNQGYGHLEIDEDYNAPAVPVLQLGAGITEASLSVTTSADGSSLILTDGITGDQITLDNMVSRFEWGVAEVQFADGSTLTAQELETMASEVNGTSGSDTLTGTSGSEVFNGDGGNDIEVGGGGSDVFIYNPGYGQLEISEDYFGGQTPILQLSAGITAASLSVTASADGTSLILSDGIAGDQITLDNMLSKDEWGVTEVRFADGTTLTAAQLIQQEFDGTGTPGADVLAGTIGADVFDSKGVNGTVEIGNGGSDTFIYNEGYHNLTIDEDYNDPDTPVLKLGAGITESSLSVTTSADGSSLILTDGIAGDQITLDNIVSRFEWGVIEVQFADGSTLTAQELGAMTSEVNGTTGSDTLTGTSGSEVFNGDGGNDVEVGGGGSDVFIYNLDYGQLEINEDYFSGQTPILQLGAGITAASLSVTASADGSSLILTDGIAGDQITLDNMLSKDEWGVTEVRFADGTTLTAAQLIQQELNGTGTPGADVLAGTIGADVFDSKGVNGAVEIGNGGSDTFIYNQGYGDVEINEDYNDPDTPILQLGSGITESSLSVTTSADGSNLILSDGIAGDQITLDNMVSRNEWGVTSVQFADGSTLSAQQLLAMATPITGTTSSQTLTGTALSDVFDAEGTADTEIGGGGNDTYTFRPGYGALTIENGVASNDVANGNLSILNESPDYIWFSQVGNNLQVDVMGTTTEATIQGWFSNSYNQLNSIATTNSTGTTSITDSQINQLVQAMANYSAQNPGFDPTSAVSPMITDPTLLALVSSSYHANP